MTKLHVVRSYKQISKVTLFLILILIKKREREIDIFIFRRNQGNSYLTLQHFAILMVAEINYSVEILKGSKTWSTYSNFELYRYSVWA